MGILVLLLYFGFACGGGGSDIASTTIGGTGTGGTSVSKASGPIDQFGSIYVGGIHFDTDGISPLIEGQTGSLSELELGMWVEVEGTVDASGNTGTATNVSYSAHIAGVVLATGTNTMTLGAGNSITIEVDQLTQYGANVNLPLQVGNDLVITGQYRTSSNNFWASHVGLNTRALVRLRSREDLTPTLAGNTELLLHLEIDTLVSGNIWESEGINLDFSEARNNLGGNLDIQQGRRVTVRGRRDSNGRMTVTEYSLRETLTDTTEVSGSIEKLPDHPPRVTLAGNVQEYRIEPFTIFEDQSTDRQQRFGFRELETGNSVVLTLSSSGVVLKLRKE